MSRIIASGACPTFFQAQCREAQNGEDLTFTDVGRQFACVVLSLSPNEMEDDEWAEQVETLSQHLNDGNDEEALGWLDQRLPRCMKLIPAEERDNFLQGLYLAVTEDEIDITLD